MRAVIKQGLPMRTTTVKRTELLEIVRKNREQHIADYQEACQGYREAAVDAITKRISEISKDLGDILQTLSNGTVVRISPHVGLSFNLTVPESHVKDYDQVIRMLELEVDETVKLQSDEFACFVMDDWDWKDAFTQSVGTYSKKFGG